MIPNMSTQLGLSESAAGWLAGWNYMGYLAGLFIVWLVSDLRAKDFFYRYGLVVAVLSTAVMAAHGFLRRISRAMAISGGRSVVLVGESFSPCMAKP